MLMMRGVRVGRGVKVLVKKGFGVFVTRGVLVFLGPLGVIFSEGFTLRGVGVAVTRRVRVGEGVEV
jgi:hypothetical protein